MNNFINNNAPPTLCWIYIGALYRYLTDLLYNVMMRIILLIENVHHLLEFIRSCSQYIGVFVMEFREPNVFDHWGPRDTVRSIDAQRIEHSSNWQCVTPDHLTDTPKGYHLLTLLTNRRKLTW